MSKQSIYNILAAKAEPVKVDLALINDFGMLKSKIIMEKDEIFSDIEQIRSLIKILLPKIKINSSDSSELSDMAHRLRVSSKEIGVNFDTLPIMKDFRRAYENQKEMFDFREKASSL